MFGSRQRVVKQTTELDFHIETAGITSYIPGLHLIKTYLVGVTTEGSDVLLGPLQSEDLVLEGGIGLEAGLGNRHEAEGAETVVDGDEDDTSLGVR